MTVMVSYLSLRKVVVFDKVDVVFDVSGQHTAFLVTGVNHDAAVFDQQDQESNKTNATGKSLLLASLMTVLNDAPPLSNKANSRKDILTGESEIRIGFISKPDPNQSPIKYKVIQKQGKYVIHENGIDLKIPRIDLAKKRLSQIFPLTSSDMYNYVYYSTQRPLGFLVESNTRRSEILSDLFRLGVHDQLKEYFLQIQRSQKADTVVLDDIVAEKAKVEAQLESCVWSDDQQAKLERYETLREVYQDKILEATKTLTTLRQAVSDIRSIHVVYTKKDGYLTAIADFIAKNPDLTVLLSVTRPELLKFLLREKHHREAVTDYHNKVDRYKKNVQSKMTSVVDAAKLLADFIKGHEQAFLDSNLPSWLDRVFDVIENQPAYTKDHSDFLTDLETAVYGEGHSCAQAMAALKSDSKLQERRAADLSHVLTTLKRLTRRYKDISSITDTLNKACVMYKAPCSNHDYSPLQAKLLRLVKNISYKNGFLLGVIRDLKAAMSKIDKTQDDNDTVTCPTCGTDVCDSHFDDILQRYTQQQTKLAESLTRVSETLDLLKLHGDVLDVSNKARSCIMAEPSHELLTVEDIEKIIAKCSKRSDHLKNSVDISARFIGLCVSLRGCVHNAIIAQAKELPKMSDVYANQAISDDAANVTQALSKLSDSDIADLIQNLERLRKATQEYNHAIKSNTSIHKATNAKVDASMTAQTLKHLEHDLSSKAHDSHELVNKHQAVSGKITRLLTSLHKRKNANSLYASRLEELSAKQHEYEIKTADKKLISSLVSAYGSKGLKNLAFTQIAVSIQHYLNFFSDLLFAEQMSFSVTSTTTGISVIVTRPNGKQSDVRLLSGSESNCFSLIYLLTVLAMIPASRRTNFVVLDEMDSHMDDACRDRFYTKYVPILKTVVPNVFVITPKSIDTMSSSNMSVFDKVITIVKKGGVSNVKIDALGGSDENI